MPSSNSFGPTPYLRVLGSCCRNRCCSRVVTRPQTVPLLSLRAVAISVMPSGCGERQNSEMISVARRTDWMFMISDYIRHYMIMPNMRAELTVLRRRVGDDSHMADRGGGDSH